MLDMESRIGRRIVGRIETGRPLEEALLAVCRKYAVEACEVRLSGILRDPILLAYREEDSEFTGAYRVPGLATLVAFQGDVSLLGDEPILNGQATVVWDDRGFARVLGGHLKSATVHAVEFVLHAFDDISIERGFDPPTRLPLWTTFSRKEAAGQSADAADARRSPAPRLERSSERVERGSERVERIERVERVERVERSPERPERAEREERSVPEPRPSRELRAEPTPPRVRSAEPERPSPPPEVVEEVLRAEEQRNAEERTIEVVRKPPRLGAQWSDAIKRSEELDQDDEDEDEEIELRKGDILAHPRFGRCTVLSIDEDERVVVRRPGGGTAALARTHMKLYPSGSTEQGQTIYRLSVVRPAG